MYASANKSIIALDNGLSPVRRQAIIWTNTGILSIGPLGTKFSEILYDILIFRKDFLDKVLFSIPGPFWYQGLLDIEAWIIHYFHIFQWYVITHPYLSFSSGLNKPKLVHGWVITSHSSIHIFFIHPCYTPKCTQHIHWQYFMENYCHVSYLCSRSFLCLILDLIAFHFWHE